MNTQDRRSVLSRAVGRGYFPHQLSWLIDNPLRRVLISPEQLADRIPLTRASTILEIGPGSGFFSGELARRVPDGRLELLDLQPEMLAKAQRKLLGQGHRNIGFTAHDVSTPLPYRDEAFQVVLLVAVLGEVPDTAACLEHVRRVLRPGGTLAIHEHIPDPDRIPLSALRPMVERAGYLFDQRWGPNWNCTATFLRA